MNDKADNLSAIEKAVARLDRAPRRIDAAPAVTRKVIEPLPIPSPKYTHQNVKTREPEPEPTAEKKPPITRKGPRPVKPDPDAGPLIALENPDPQTIDEFRRIKRPLIARAFGKGAELVDRGNLIMVTSAMPNEGKTNVAVNLARSIAMERNNTVLLIDADVSIASMSRMYDLRDKPGLLDLLLDNTLDSSEVMVRTDFPDLVVLPVGQQHEHAVELMSSNEMEGLLDEIASRYADRIVMFDSPPLLAGPEAPVLAKYVGQIVVVVEADRTRQHVVQLALDELDHKKPIGIVLNKCRTQAHAPGRIGHGYSYGH